MLVSFFLNLLLLPFLPYRLWRTWAASPKRGVVTIKIAGTVEELCSPRRRFVLPWQRSKPPFSLHHFTRMCGTMRDDPRVRGLRVELHPFNGGFAIAEGLREALKLLGKPAWVYLPKGGGLKEYYVASAGEHITMPGPADLRLLGLGGRSLYFGEVLAKLGVEAEVEQRYEFKSMGEMFTRSGMSEPARAQLTTIVEELKARIFSAIGERVKSADLDTLLTSGPYRAEEAKRLGLVDAVGFGEQLDDSLSDTRGKAKKIAASDYAAVRLRPLFRPFLRRKRVAVIRLAGVIVDEARSVAQASADGIIPLLDAARKNRRIASVVLLVDSRGGSAFATAEIHHALLRLLENKPVVAYLSDYAASGGYYAAAPCREIVARPMTVTGSIGVVALRPVIDPLLAKLGIARDGVSVGAHAGMLDASQRWSEAERQAMRKSLDETYAEFTGVVKDGRKLDDAEVDAVARGRVWLGSQALSRKLVDHLGGFKLALERAAALGSVKTPGEPMLLEGKRRLGGLPLALFLEGGMVCFESLEITQ